MYNAKEVYCTQTMKIHLFTSQKDAKMKILLTIEDISFGRGAERVTVNLANAFAERRHKVSILSFYQRHPTLPYTNINPQVKLSFKYNYEQSMAQESAKKQFFKGFYYKNIHKILLSYGMRKADYDFIVSSGFIYFPYFKNPKTKYIKIIHTSFQRYSSRNKYFDILITLSNKELPLWRQYHKNVQMIPNFIPQIPQKCTNHKQKVIISVGSLTAEKGFLRLLDIWKMVQDRIKLPHPKSLPQGEGLDFDSPSPAEGDKGGGFDSQNLTKWKLIIVGDGILKSQMESKINDLGLQDSIILKPFTKEIEKEYLSASIYAMSSHWEGFGMVLVEACSYGLPCIAFDVATGPSDIIKHSKSGFLISDNDLEAYANHLLKLMGNESMRINFGIEAKRIVGERFSKEVIMGEWERILENC